MKKQKIEGGLWINSDAKESNEDLVLIITDEPESGVSGIKIPV